MSALLELIRTSSPAERAQALVELSRDALANAAGPVAIVDEHRKAVAYLSSEADATAVFPFRKLTPEHLGELRRRADHPEEAIPAEEFIRLLEGEISKGTGR